MKIRRWLIVVVLLFLGLVWFAWEKAKTTSLEQETEKIIVPRRGDIRSFISATGTVLPKNRLQIKPPVNGRIEQVLVVEGQKVKAGDALALMSSTERAALLDAARGRGEAALKEWQDVYKAIVLVSPIDGEVIVGTIQPGQTLTTGDDVVVISDRLIVRAEVDETDIGKVYDGQNADISFDAYPATKLRAQVDHIYYESKTVNNVTIYSVDLVLENTPSFLRSGMNANIDFIVEAKKDVLLLSAKAVQRNNGDAVVLLDAGPKQKPVERKVVLGISDDKDVEIVSGLTESDEVVLIKQKYSLPKNSGGTNPFMPARRR